MPSLQTSNNGAVVPQAATTRVTSRNSADGCESRNTGLGVRDRECLLELQDCGRVASVCGAL